MKVSRVLTTVLTFVTCVFVSAAAGQDQDLKGGGGRRVSITGERTGPTTSTPRRSSRPPGATVVRKVEKVFVTPTTGALSVATEPMTDVVVEPLFAGTGRNRPQPLQGTVPQGQGLFIFNGLKPGRYKVTADLDGYKPASQQVVIAANKNIPLTLNLEPITYDVAVETNVKQGEVRYVTKGESPRVVPIRNGRAMIAGLRPGVYDIDIRPEELGYDTLLATIEVAEGKTLFKAELKKLLSKETFSATWISLEEWDAPTTWRVASRKLSVNGQGVALPRNENFRYYANFELSSDAMMVNGRALSFALRARDAKNYYLIQLTGPQADEPYVLRGFLVKDGVAQRLQQPIPTDGFASTIKPKQFFNVSVTAVDNRFTVSIRDSSTGDVFPLGVITDPNRNFNVGAVGIAAREGEQTEVGTFTVCTPECPKGSQ